MRPFLFNQAGGLRSFCTRAFSAFAYVVLVVSIPINANAQWLTNGAPVATGPLPQQGGVATTDGANGAIVAWNDLVMRVQRLDDGGFEQWSPGGVVLASGLSGSTNPQIVSDGAGGAIVMWRQVFEVIKAQRVDAAGTPLWASGGVTVDSTGQYGFGVSSSRLGPNLISDGTGGAIATYTWLNKTYAQRITSAGALPWGSDGVLMTSVNTQTPLIVADGFGGAIVAWEDNRIDFFSDVYAQRVNASGVVQWAPDGVPIVVQPNFQEAVNITSDGFGGAIMNWSDIRFGFANAGVYTQRVDGAGNTLWALDGVKLDVYGVPVTDGLGGAVVVGSTKNTDIDLAAQRITATGSFAWPTLTVSAASGTQNNAFSVTTSSGAIVTAWEDWRGGVRDIFAAVIDTSGLVFAAPDGDSLCTASDHQGSLHAVAAGGGGAIFVWRDERAGTYDVYAALYGLIPVSVPQDTPFAHSLELRNFPNPFNPSTVITYHVPRAGRVTLDIYDAAGRRVTALVNELQNAGNKRVEWNRETEGAVASGVYFAVLEVNAERASRKMVLLK